MRARVLEREDRWIVKQRATLDAEAVHHERREAHVARSHASKRHCCSRLACCSCGTEVLPTERCRFGTYFWCAKRLNKLISHKFSHFWQKKATTFSLDSFLCNNFSTNIVRPERSPTSSMGASKSKSAKVAAYDEENDTGPTDSRKRNLMNKGAGRLEGRKPSSSEDDAVPRDNLSSAPSTRSGASLPAVTSPAVKRTHSAPRWSRPEEATGDRASAGSQARPKAAAGTPGEQSKEGKRVPPQSQLNRLGEYVIEGPNTAEQIDEYLANVLGPACAKNLRSAVWAQRVQATRSIVHATTWHVCGMWLVLLLRGMWLYLLCVYKLRVAIRSLPLYSRWLCLLWQGLELLSSLLHGGREMQVQEPLPLYKACVTVLARALQDKVVPVFLPALQLLVDVYSDAFLSKLPSGMPLDPLPLFARQLVLRSGSSNVRNSGGSTPW